MGIAVLLAVAGIALFLGVGGLPGLFVLGPSDQDVIGALNRQFSKGHMPMAFTKSFLGGGIYTNTLKFEVLKKGALVKQSPQPLEPGNYYPARVRIRGRGWTNQLFEKKEQHDFDVVLEVHLRKGDYGEWQADFNAFQPDQP